MTARRLSLSMKLFLGFFTLALLAAAVGGIGIYALNVTTKAAQELGRVRMVSLQSVSGIGSNFMTINQTEMAVLLPGLTREQRSVELGKMAAAAENLKANIKAFGEMSLSGEEKQLWLQFVEAFNSWQAAHAKVGKMAMEMHEMNLADAPTLAAKLDQGYDEEGKWVAELENSIAYAREFKGETDPDKTGFGKWLAAYKTQSSQIAPQLSALKEARRELYDSAKELNQILKDPVRFLEAKDLYDAKFKPAKEKLFKLIADLSSLPKKEVVLRQQATGISLNEAQPIYVKAETALKNLSELIGKQATLRTDQVLQTAGLSRWVALAAVAVCVVFALLLGFLLTRGISRPLRQAVSVLEDASGVVLETSKSVMQAGDSLAKGAGTQAAALEQSAASLEEIASMTKRNAENADQADGMMRETGRIVTEANHSISQLKEAIEKITEASGKTAQIIRTIDEIAFQTNLLALNAAVEAARAGEAGAGFAVVADEVRNLAMRAAEAAKGTSDLIEENLANIKRGSQIMSEADEAFLGVAESATNAGELVGEIAAASKEQAFGIAEVNRAIGEVDTVTQQNASNADRSADEARQLITQASSMLETLGEISAIVEGYRGLGHIGAGKEIPKLLEAGKGIQQHESRDEDE